MHAGTPSLIFALSGLFAAAASAPLPAQLRHVQPSARAAAVARELPWHASLEAALERAQTSGRPVFWYVPTVPRSPMDRKPVVDLYMRAGFLCDPDLRALLAGFELYGKAPTRAEAKRFELTPFRFVEPGFLVLTPAGELRVRRHAISTFSPTWFASSLGARVAAGEGDADALRSARLRGEGEALRALLAKPRADSAEDEYAAELGCQLALAQLYVGDNARALATLARSAPSDRVAFLRAAAHAMSGRPARAKKMWAQLAAKSESALWASRAAAEAEGFGPIGRGFWSFRELLPGWERPEAGTTRARDAGELGVLVSRNLELLFALQGESGGFEDSNYDYGGLDSLPNVYVAGTALACQALWRYRDRAPDKHGAAVRRGLEYCLDPARRNEADKDEWIWARVYTLELLASLLDAAASDGAELAGFPRDRLAREALAITNDIFSRQQGDGSFRHEYANPFVTATVLHALASVRAHGVALPEPEIERALASLVRCRTKLGAYSYGQTRARRPARATVPAAAGRMPLCESALLAFGRSTDELLGAALARAFEHHDELEKSRKYDDHAGALGIGGFFFWYDLRARARALRAVEGASASDMRTKMLATICAIPELDGVWIDSHELGRSYGAAMGLLCAKLTRD